jgi:hypothetical protein
MNWRKVSPRECTGKRQHKSRGKAEAALRAYECAFPKEQGQMRVYLCGTCHSYHIGHRRGLKRKKEED